MNYTKGSSSVMGNNSLIYLTEAKFLWVVYQTMSGLITANYRLMS